MQRDSFRELSEQRCLCSTLITSNTCWICFPYGKKTLGFSFKISTFCIALKQKLVSIMHTRISQFQSIFCRSPPAAKVTDSNMSHKIMLIPVFQRSSVFWCHTCSCFHTHWVNCTHFHIIVLPCFVSLVMNSHTG